MLIGIVSKDEHIKNHAKALRDEGFSVLGLGSSPTEVPPTVDLLILRTQSCSHGGSNTAYSWNRLTKKPLIVENGLSGIRSKLQALFPERKKNTPSKEFVQVMAPATSEILVSKPGAFYAAFPVLPSSVPWDIRAVPEARLKRAFEEAQIIFKRLSPKVIAEIGNYLKSPTSPLKWGALGLGADMYGRPLTFIFVLLWCLPQPLRKEVPHTFLQRSYREFSGANSTKAYTLAASWVSQNQGETSEKPEALVSKPPETQVETLAFEEVFGQAFSQVTEGSESVLEAPVEVSSPVEAPVEAPVEVSSPVEAPGEVSLELLRSIPGSLSLLRSDVEQFLLEVSSANQQLLTMVQSLRGEVSTLREEISALRGEATSQKQDPLSAILALRDQGASVTVTFGGSK